MSTTSHERYSRESARSGSIRVEDAATRQDLAAALTELRQDAGLSVREVVTASGGLHGTISGWLSGQHLPTTSNFPMFDAVLEACGVTAPADRQPWRDAVGRARTRRGRRDPHAGAPYRGLEAFRETDAEWFFGRDGLTHTVLDRIGVAASADHDPVIVIGPSGTGKSSLLRAGVVPRLRETDAFGRVLVTTPAGVPDLLAEIGDAQTDEVGQLPTEGTTEHRGGTVLVVDQFEEIWTQSFPEATRTDILRSLTDRDYARRLDLVVVLALRADFYGSASAEPDLIAALASPVVVGPMGDAQLREIIVAPATKAGARVDESLVQLLVDETRPHGAAVAFRAGTLPLLSHALMSTWARSRHKTLTVADYYSTGGIGGAVQQSAEAVYAALSETEQAVAKRVFLRLVAVDSDDDLVTRRRATRVELLIDRDDTDVTAVVDAFVERRLLTVGDDTVEVSHEILISAWDRLRRWIDANRAGLVVGRQVTDATKVWIAAGRDESALMSGRRLAVVREWADSIDVDATLTPEEREFLAAGVDAENAKIEGERHRYRVLRRLAGALAVVTIVAIVAAVVAGIAQYNANNARATAEVGRSEAMARQIATQAEKLRTLDPALAAQMALASYRVAPTLESRSALLDATAVLNGTRIVGPAGGMKSTFAPDGSWFASATADGTVRLFSTDDVGAAPSPIGSIDAFDSDHPPYAMAVDASGTRLAVGGQGGSALWDVTDPSAPRRLAGLDSVGDASVQDLTFTPDGRYVLAGTSDSSFLRWDVADPAHPVALPPMPVPGTGRVVLAVSPDERLLVTGGTQNTLRIWDAAHIDELDVPLFEIPADPDSTNSRLSIAFSPDSATLLVGTTGRTVERWSLADPRAPRPLPGLTGFESYVNAVDVSDDGRFIAAGSSDNSVRVWRAGDDTLVHTLPGPAVVTSVEFAPDGDHLLTGGVDGVTRLWPLPGPMLGGATDSIFTLPVSGGGDLLLAGTGSRDRGLHLWDISDPRAARALPDLLPQDGDRFTGATALSDRRDLAAAGTAAGSVYLWDVARPAAPAQVSRTAGVVGGIVGLVAFSPEADLLAVTDQSDDAVHILDITDAAHPRAVGVAQAANYPQSMDFSPDGHTLAVADADNTVELWDMTDPARPALRQKLTGFETYAQATAFSPDGTLLAAGSADRSVRVWDVRDLGRPKLIGVMPELGASVYSVDFDHAGDRLAAATASGDVRVWDIHGTAAPTPAATLTAADGRTFDARFARDGVLAAAGTAHNVHLWTIGIDAAADQICATRGTRLTEDEWARYLPGVPVRSLCR